MVTHQLHVERRTGKVRRPETDVLRLCHATNLWYGTVNMNATAYAFLSWQRPAVLLVNEYESVDPVYPLHIPTNNFPTVSFD